MGRGGAVMLVLLVLTIGSSGTARGKGMSLDHVVLQGPGLEAPLRLSREEFGIVRSASSPAAVALEGLHETHSEIPPTDELGPRYKLSYHQNVGFWPETKKSTVRVDLYPYAGGGPVAFIPPGQFTPHPMGAKPIVVSSGWHEYPRVLIENLRRHGLPSEIDARIAATSLPSWVWLSAAISLSGGISLILGKHWTTKCKPASVLTRPT